MRKLIGGRPYRLLLWVGHLLKNMQITKPYPSDRICPNYVSKKTNIVAFIEKDDILNIKIFGISHSSAEHALQYSNKQKQIPHSKQNKYPGWGAAPQQILGEKFIKCPNAMTRPNV